MPHKNSDKQQPTPAVALRRSPRFLQIVLADLEDPKTPKPKQQRRTQIPSSVSLLSLNGSLKVSPCRRSHRSKSKEYSQKLDDSCNSRRSTKLNRRADECNAVKVSRSSNRRLERRATRSSCCTDLDKNVVKAYYGDLSGNTSHGCSSGDLVTEERAGISKRFKGSRKNNVKASKRKCDNNFDQRECEALECDDKTGKRVLSITEKQVLGEQSSEKHVDKTTNGISVTTAIVVHEGPINRRDANKSKNIEVKRTRNQFENTLGISQGWTKDQELALEKAYLDTKPTPHFWKNVSRLVPGKCAQECFDKVHGSHLTPPQPRTRSRPRVSNPKNPSLSPSKLLNSSSPATKRPRYRKQKSHILHRTARHMLQNQFKVEQDSEADLFSALEPISTQNFNCHAILTTPVRSTDQVLKRCQDRSTSHKKGLSRFSSLYEAPLMSPPVLKQVKNKALHEKYIDQLHCREANRKAANAKVEKLNQRQVRKPENYVERKDAIKAAKNALVFGAKDAINEFQDQQARGLSNLFDDESGADADEDDS